MSEFLDGLPVWLSDLLILSTAAFAGLLGYSLLRTALRLAMPATTRFVVDPLVARCRAPAGVLLPLIGFHLALPLTTLDAELEWVRNASRIALIITVTWLVSRLVRFGEDVILSRLALETADNLRARAVQTQFRILRHVVNTLIVVLGLTGVLLSIERFREFGAGLLASAGIASIVLGFAAQRTLGNLFAGFQIAITQPIRFDDVLVVEGEWGRVEEITLTYVVLRIWDLRRLVVPISYFLEKPFQNWTRTSADIIGAVNLYLDYTVDVAAVRTELERIVSGNELWNGKVCNLQVTDADAQGVTLRALVSSGNSGAVWDLRCQVREQLIGFVQREFPEALPRLRASVDHAEGDR
ncbi:MAG TPA: mechanosensitive ion channel domain-containing protein [Gammaproteobacteria bacterium]|nr:mechanosensitive ion channel domain-containing protein [Gammaproteobacteria bacterium]